MLKKKHGKEKNDLDFKKCSMKVRHRRLMTENLVYVPWK